MTPRTLVSIPDDDDPASPGDNLKNASIVMPSPVQSFTSFSREQHRQRLLTIQRAESAVLQCERKNVIWSYLPGQASYQIGEYPSLEPYEVTEYDEAELDRLSTAGVQVIQIMEDWNDILRLHGADKFTSQNATGLRRFIDAAHSVGIRVLLYVSSGYMQAGDPDLDLSWTREPVPARPQALHWKLMRCSPASSGWRHFLFTKLEQVLHDWDIDGIYDDWGHTPPLATNPLPPTPDETLAWQETAQHDAAKEDLLATIYQRLNSDGKLFKLHADFNNAPMSAETLYDYLWVGEGVGNLRKTLNETKWHRPFVVPAFDTRFGGVPEDHKYLYSIPYMQFPQLFAGKPLTGERAVVPGIEYLPEEADPLLSDMRRYRAALEHGEITTPAYSCWDMSLNVEPNTRQLFTSWLRTYKELTAPGTHAYLEVTRTSLITSELPDDVVLSIFANTHLYLVLANFSNQSATIQTEDTYLDARNPAEPPSSTWDLHAQTLQVLKRAEPARYGLLDLNRVQR